VDSVRRLSTWRAGNEGSSSVPGRGEPERPPSLRSPDQTVPLPLLALQEASSTSSTKNPKPLEKSKDNGGEVEESPDANLADPVRLTSTSEALSHKPLARAHS